MDYCTYSNYEVYFVFNVSCTGEGNLMEDYPEIREFEQWCVSTVTPERSRFAREAGRKDKARLSVQCRERVRMGV